MLDELPQKTIVEKENFVQAARDQGWFTVRFLHPFRALTIKVDLKDGSLGERKGYETLVAAYRPGANDFAIRRFYASTPVMQELIDKDFTQERYANFLWEIKVECINSSRYMTKTIIGEKTETEISRRERSARERSLDFWNRIPLQRDWTSLGRSAPVELERFIPEPRKKEPEEKPAALPDPIPQPEPGQRKLKL
jgi:hypothetical protein